MKRILLIGGGAFALLIIAAAVVPFLIPNEVYKTQIETAATEALGREVSLEGDVRLSILPRISASVSQVTVANPEGFSRDHMVEAGELRGQVRWAPLLSRRVEVAEIAFVDADVRLERRADGAVNWEFASEAPAEPASEGGGGAPAIDTGIDRAVLENARLVYGDDTTGALYEVSELDLTASLQSLAAPLTLEASGLFQGAGFDVDLSLDAPQALLDGAAASLQAALETQGGRVEYDGTLRQGDVVELDGGFAVEGRDLTALAALAGVEAPINLAALGQVTVAGQISGPLDTASITLEPFALSGGGLDGRYAGAITLGDALSVNGRAELDSRDLGAWIKSLGLEVPGAVDILKDVTVAATLAGPLDALTVTEAQISQDGPLLKADFNGGAQLGAASSLNGRLSASSDALRGLLAAADIALAPGDTLQAFDVSAAVAGDLTSIRLSDLSATLDDVNAAGAMTLDLSGPRPAVSGALTTGLLDLSPFLGQDDGAPAEGGGGWSDAPLDLTGLQTVDADVTLKADRILIGDIALEAPDLGVALTAGDLDANINSMGLFGGQWQGLFNLDASRAVPRLDIDLTGQTIQISDALSSLAGLSALSGIGSLRIDVESQGESLKALVEGLTGELGTDVADGALKGINVGQLVRSRETLVQSLASGSLALALEPEAETDFSSLLAGLSVEGGVAEIDAFDLISPVLSLQGDGTIDLLNQTLDVGIVPRLDTSGQGGGNALQLNGIPIPFRIRGSWLSPGLSPDTQMIQSILRQDVENRARDALRGQAGDGVGGLLEGVLGSGRSGPAPSDEGSDTGQAPASEAPRNTEDVVEGIARDAAREALGGLFGNRRPQTSNEDEGDTPQ
ncbi:MAG: AsmA family protein [Pseudomonadota bacterium]